METTYVKPTSSLICSRSFSHYFSPRRILCEVYDRGAFNRDVRDRTCNSFATPTRVPCPVGTKKKVRREGEWPSLICGMCLITICPIMLLGIPRRWTRHYKKTSLVSFSFSLSLSLYCTSKIYGVFALSERMPQMIPCWSPGDISWRFLAQRIYKVSWFLRTYYHVVSNLLQDMWLCCRYFPQCDKLLHQPENEEFSFNCVR